MFGLKIKQCSGTCFGVKIQYKHIIVFSTSINLKRQIIIHISFNFEETLNMMFSAIDALQKSYCDKTIWALGGVLKRVNLLTITLHVYSCEHLKAHRPLGGISIIG